MKHILIVLIIGVFTNATYSQSKKEFSQSVGIKTSHTINFFPSSASYQPNQYYFGSFGLHLDYNRLIKGTKHFLATGLGIQYATFTSQNVDTVVMNMLGEYDRILDFNYLIVVPTHYIYKPKPWLILSTGLNNKIPIRGNTEHRGSNYIPYYREGIPDYRRFIVEYHAGIGVEVGTKKVKLRTEVVFNRSILPWEYYDVRGSLGLFYHFGK